MFSYIIGTISGSSWYTTTYDRISWYTVVYDGMIWYRKVYDITFFILKGRILL